MPGRNALLSALEITALMQIRLKSDLEPRLRTVVGRLVHLGLIEQGPDGYFVTDAGAERCRREAEHLGLAPPR